jgi:hypothetical protein
LEFTTPKKARRGEDLLKHWQSTTLILCAIICGLFVVRDAWIFPNRAALRWDIEFSVAFMLCAMLLWLGTRFLYFEVFRPLMGICGTAWLTVKSWTSGKHLLAVIAAIIAGCFIYILIKVINKMAKNTAHALKKREAGVRP